MLPQHFVLVNHFWDDFSKIFIFPLIFWDDSDIIINAI